MKRLSYFIPLAIFLVLAVYFTVQLLWGRDPKIIPSALIDKPVPEFALPPITGGRGKGLSSADLKDKVSVVNVFASWCIPCRAEHPVVTQLGEKEGITLYGLNYKDQPDAALTWLRELGDPYKEIGADNDGRVAIDWGVYGVPETFVIDRAGSIRYKHVGPMTWDALEKKILPAIEALQR